MADEPEAVDTMFEDAVDALRQGERARGKEILTRLLQADQNNPNYWIWMSAAVDSAKERIYCLETALKLDPQNAIAKRGLVLLGGIQPDENIQPFPLNRPRPWEDSLLLAHERPQEERGAGMRSSLGRMAGITLLGLIAVGAAAYFFLFLPRGQQFLRPLAAGTAGPSPTFTLTPTFVNVTPVTAAATQAGPTPLEVLLDLHYTPTPAYINTPRSPVSADSYRYAKQAFQAGNWDEYIRLMEEVEKSEPKAADIPYSIGEAYRLRGDCRTALNYYNQSLQVDANFAPGYLGLARARLCIDPGADTSQLYDLAIQADPNFVQAYLERANFNLVQRDYEAALPDLQQAQTLAPDSALVQLGFAQAYALKGDTAAVLEAAKKANSIDQTLLPAYLMMGYAYSASGQYSDALRPLQLYVTYMPKDPNAYELLGQAYTNTGEYRSAVKALEQALEYDPTQVRAFVYLGTAYLRLDDLDKATDYFKRAIQYFPDSFEANIGLTEVLYKQGTFGSSYLQAETAKSKATDDRQLARAIYWRALSQEGRKAYGDAAKDWATLLAMPEDALTPDMVQAAQQHLASLTTPTATPKGGAKTPTPTRTVKPSGSATVTPTPTRTPTATPTP